ncbi:MAG: ATP-dependent DNA helicase RecG [Alphaproteobacteria bacterium]|nr:ATP-dependent DNA helicase RecG [Alphaproteobacteria bacterium]
MRPQILFPLFADVATLSGIGPRFAKLIGKLAGPRLVDLLWHKPVSINDWRAQSTIRDAPWDTIVTLKLTIVEHKPGRVASHPYKIRGSDETGFIDLVFFRGHKDYLKNALPIGETRYVSGKVERFENRPQITHPDRILDEKGFAAAPAIEPVYGGTEGLPPRTLTRTVTQSVAKAMPLPEWQDAAWLKKQGWSDWLTALKRLHAPESLADLDPTTPFRRRLAFDEMLASQLALALARARMRKTKGRSLKGDGKPRATALKALKFTLTKSQDKALAEIFTDMASTDRMLRLLQGDVGAGKTLVAFFAMLNAIECGKQAALMAPTEVLARQHFAVLKPLGEAAGVSVALLTGRERGKERDATLERLASGDLKILIGTHALISETVIFNDLALAVVDEQHRFGVHQRLALSGKGNTPVDILVMTATPIPRTLALTAYGDMDMSRITEKPAGRKPIATRAIPLTRLDEVIEGVERALSRDERVFWVCPLVEENEDLDLTAAEERFDVLRATFGDRVRLIHGRMKPAEKDAAIGDFRAGRANILVATTVIEVGVDVPDATIIVIEHAERFGLAQLHQLRGRVGRSDKASTCVLLYQAPLGETARARLDCLRTTEDGFKIAEEDLRLRGAGELLGQRQSGLPGFRLADLEVHSDLIQPASDDARLIVARDPDLQTPRGEALRVLLYLFEQDDAVKTIKSG